MEAVKTDGKYNIINPRTGEITGQENARDIFNLIVENAHAGGDPGIIFIDRVNEHNPLPLIGEIESTNPCLAGETWVITSDGPRTILDINHKSSGIALNGNFYDSTQDGFFITGKKTVYRLSTDRGYTIQATANHPILTAASSTRYKFDKEWKKVSDIHPGDKIILSNNRGIKKWGGKGTFEEGYLLGLLLGDGTIKKNEAVISVWGADEDSIAIMNLAEKCALSLPHRSDFSGFQKEIKGRNERRLKLHAILELSHSFGITHDTGKHLREIEKASYDFYRGFLLGLFDTDGTVTGNQKKGVSVRLWQHDKEILSAVQRMLHRMGIASTVYLNRKPEEKKLMPDGKGGHKEYYVSSGHELVISNDNIIRFHNLIGFTHTGKKNILLERIKGYKRKPNRERFVARVTGITKGNNNEVFDIQIPGVNAFDANGIVVHNCGEQPLLPYESCNLGSINLSLFVTERNGRTGIDWKRLGRVTHLATRLLDSVIEVNKYPILKIAEETARTRKIGLGVMGFADMLIRLGVPYDSEEGERIAEQVMEFIDTESKAESRHLAKLRGPFPAFDGSRYDTQDEPPQRNATTTTIAPTGTISIIASCSSGIEPLFALAYKRNVLDGKQLTEFHPIFRETAEKAGILNRKLQKEITESTSIAHLSGIPSSFKRIFRTAGDIPVEWHIRIQAAFQRYTDNAVSKTINFPREATVQDVSAAYIQAYDAGLKGLTIYRDGSKEKQVLTIQETGRVSKKPGKRKSIKPRPRPPVTTGTTEKLITGCGNLYVTVNRDESGLCEVFCQMGRSGGCTSSQSEAISRLISLALRSGVKLEEIVLQLKGIRCPSSIWYNGSLILSCSDAIATALSRYLDENAATVSNTPEIPVLTKDADSEDLSDALFAGRRLKGEMAGVCPDCGGVLEYAEGCMVCRICGYSKCG